jgi:hypothetical protein
MSVPQFDRDGGAAEQAAPKSPPLTPWGPWIIDDEDREYEEEIVPSATTIILYGFGAIALVEGVALLIGWVL